MKKLVSIIIVNWNGERWLQKCLDTLHTQTYKNFEVVFVDNNSKDDSIEFVTNNFPKVNIVKSKENLGFAGGNNLGIKAAKGEYILLLNNDTWVENNFLEKLLKAYSFGRYDVIAPIEARYDGSHLGSHIMILDTFGHGFGIHNTTRESFYSSGVCMLFSKQTYVDTGGLDSNFFMYCEEADWFWRLNLMDKKFCRINDLFVYHFGAGSTGNGIKYLSSLWRNQNTLQMLLKNYKWFNLLWVLPIYFIQNIFEIIFFLIILKPKIAYSYIAGWVFNIKNIKKIIEKRKWVQKNRKVSDLEIMKKMYIGFGKFRHLISYYQKYVAKKSL